MLSANVAPLHYDRRTRILHWTTASLVVALWALGQAIDWFPKGTPRVFARSTHIALGLTLAFTLVMRIGWRLGKRSTHLPPAGLGWLDKIATATHFVLYALLVVTVALGVTNAWVRGDTIFNLFTLPSFDPHNKDLRETIEDWHALAANTLLIVAFLHATAALVHRFIIKDSVLQRMWPRKSP